MGQAMMYRETDLGIVALAALGAGYLLGQSLQEPVSPVLARDAVGLTIVHRIDLPTREPMANWADELRALQVPLQPQLIPALQVSDPPADKPAPVLDTSPQERAVMQVPAAPQPRNICAPGRKVEFRYHGVLRWRCQY